MKQISFLLFIILFALSIPAQIKQTPKTKPTPKPQTQKITEQQATTLDGKPVILKSDGTWQSVQVAEKPKPKPCELTLKDAPTIKSLKLAITKENVEAILKVSGNKEDAFYYATDSLLPNGIKQYIFRVNSYMLSFPSDFWDIDTLKLEFFDKQLHRIEVRYGEDAAKFTREQFKAKISEVFNLPVEGWSSSQFYSDGSISFPIAEKLQCAEFQVEVYLGHTLTLTNLLTTQKIEEIEEEKRKTFKP